MRRTLGFWLVRQPWFGNGLGRLVSRLFGVANVRWYGAKGDGVADDSRAIQDAMRAASGATFVPTGTYRYDDEKSIAL